jgi:hypothetical protein
MCLSVGVCGGEVSLENDEPSLEHLIDMELQQRTPVCTHPPAVAIGRFQFSALLQPLAWRSSLIYVIMERVAPLGAKSWSLLPPSTRKPRPPTQRNTRPAGHIRQPHNTWHQAYAKVCVFGLRITTRICVTVFQLLGNDNLRQGSNIKMGQFEQSFPGATSESLA